MTVVIEMIVHATLNNAEQPSRYDHLCEGSYRSVGHAIGALHGNKHLV